MKLISTRAGGKLEIDILRDVRRFAGTLSDLALGLVNDRPRINPDLPETAGSAALGVESRNQGKLLSIHDFKIL